MLTKVAPDTPAAVAMLHAEKAFVSLEWPLLRAVLRKLGIPPPFHALIMLLYTKLTACLRKSGTLTDAIPIFRGTIQGCPLSLLLFIIAMDPLVRALQDRHIHSGMQLTYGPLLLSLYTDKMFLFMRHPRDNLPPLMQEIASYGRLSGLCINWAKSEVFPLTDATQSYRRNTPSDGPLTALNIWVSKYIGIEIRSSSPIMDRHWPP